LRCWNRRQDGEGCAAGRSIVFWKSPC
jgi:hypothetical protein